MTSDPHVAFALWGVPRFAREPITSLIDGRDFGDLPLDDAVQVLTGIVFLQWAKSGAVGLLSVAPWLATSHLHGTPREVSEFLLGMVMMVIPSYALLIVGAGIWLRRLARRSPSETLRTKPSSLKLVRRAPFLALGIAAALVAVANLSL